MIATKERTLPTFESADTNERFSTWTTSKNIGILILTLVVLVVVSSICIRYVLGSRTSGELNQNSAAGINQRSSTWN